MADITFPSAESVAFSSDLYPIATVTYSTFGKLTDLRSAGSKQFLKRARTLFIGLPSTFDINIGNFSYDGFILVAKAPEVISIVGAEDYSSTGTYNTTACIGMRINISTALDSSTYSWSYNGLMTPVGATDQSTITFDLTGLGQVRLQLEQRSRYDPHGMCSLRLSSSCKRTTAP